MERFLHEFKPATVDGQSRMLKDLKANTARLHLNKTERKKLQRVYWHELVKRGDLMKIVAARLVTAPAYGVMAALLFFAIHGMMLP